MRITLTCTIAIILLSLGQECRADLFAEGPSSVATRLTTGHGSYDTSLLEPGLLGAGFDGRGPYTSTGLVKFTLGPALPAGAQIVTATLDLTATFTSVGLAGGANYQIFWLAGSVATSSAVSLADFDHATTMCGMTIAPAGIGTGGGIVTPGAPQTISYNVSPLIVAAMAGGGDTVSFELTSPGLGGTFDAGSPKLSIFYLPAIVPEPGSWLLAGLGCSIVLVQRRIFLGRRIGR